MPLASKGWLGGLGSLGRDVGILGQHPVFILNLVAYCPIQGAFGAYTFWGPKVCGTLGPIIHLSGKGAGVIALTRYFQIFKKGSKSSGHNGG